jgi:hypothetical protein
MSMDAFSNPWWAWLFPGFIATVVALTAGLVIDESAREKRRAWLKLLFAILGTGGVLAMIVGLVRIVLSGLVN